MATPTDLELGNLVSNSDFQARVTEAAVNWATYTLNSQPAAESVGSIMKRGNFALTVVRNPYGAMQPWFYAITRDAKFTTQNPLDLATMTDADLRAAVETTINNTILL